MLHKVEIEDTLTARGKILVMDDEKRTRDVAGRILHAIGFHVDFARDGEEAIELYKRAIESDEPFDAVIMDLNIPDGLGGQEAIEKLIEMDPKVKAIVSSGEYYDPVMHNFNQYGFSAVMPKPYGILELSRTVMEVLGMAG